MTTDGAFWRVGKPVPIAVRQGRASFRAPASTPGSEIAGRRFGAFPGERTVFGPAHGQTGQQRIGAVARRRRATRVCTNVAAGCSTTRRHDADRT